MEDNAGSYKESLEYLYGLQKFGIKFGLSKTSNILSCFNHPHLGRKYIHIAGTNGKGSVASFLCSILGRAGFRVGLYTSPHLVRFTERFRVNENEIERGQVVRLVRDIREATTPEEPPTFFEFTTAMALLYFARQQTDIDIMEVGMGGRLDATNIIKPIVSVITNISKEHTFYLGKHLSDITAEKAGIIKENVPVVTGIRQPRVLKIIESVCSRKNASLTRVGVDARYRFTRNGLYYKSPHHQYQRLEIGLEGSFQSRNAATALAALEILETAGFVVADSDVRLGLQTTKWPGRMHLHAINPRVILDGAHNPGAMTELAASIKKNPLGKRLFMVLGILEDKDVEKMIRTVVPLADHAWYSSPAYGRAAPAQRLAEAAAGIGTPGTVEPDLKRALDEALSAAEPQDAVLVCGSLYTVGEALSHLDPENWEPEIA